MQGDQRRHGPAQYLFFLRFSNHNILRRSQLVQACEQSPKELTAGKEIEGQRQLLNVWIKKSAQYREKMQLRTPSPPPCRKFLATPLEAGKLAAPHRPSVWSQFELWSFTNRITVFRQQT